MTNKYNPVYSPKYYLEFLNFLNKETIYNITSIDKKVNLSISAINKCKGDELPLIIVGDCIEECLEKGMLYLTNWGPW